MNFSENQLLRFLNDQFEAFYDHLVGQLCITYNDIPPNYTLLYDNSCIRTVLSKLPLVTMLNKIVTFALGAELVLKKQEFLAGYETTVTNAVSL